MVSRRIKKKQQKRQQIDFIKQQIKRAEPFVDAGDLKMLLKQNKTVADRQYVLNQLEMIDNFVSEQEENIAYWRDRGAKIKYGKAKFHNTLENMEKYYLIKRFYELKKEGWIRSPGNLDHYDDVADWSLENMTNEQLAEVIANAEGRKVKMPMVDFETGLDIVKH